MNYQELIKKLNQPKLLKQARYGVERESQRISQDGKLSKLDHPKVLGNRAYHPMIQTDFSETQMEIITPVSSSQTELFRNLAALHDVVYRSMESKESLWPISMPPSLPKKEEEILISKLENDSEVTYRRYLGKKYGRRKQMMSGIHFNFEFGDKFLNHLFNIQREYTDFQTFRSEVYLKVARNYLTYRWLITYFFGLSPLSEDNYFIEKTSINEPVRSIRNSSQGYQNNKKIQVRYDSLEHYTSDIKKLVCKGCLFDAKEFYSPIRLRGGKTIDNFENTGIRYIELRNLDLNPEAPYGISEAQVSFLHMFMLFLLVKTESSSEERFKKAYRHNEEVSLENPLSKTKYQTKAKNLITEMDKLCEELGIPLSDDIRSLIIPMTTDHNQTFSAKWLTKIKKEKKSQCQLAAEIAQTNLNRALKKPYHLSGYCDMELSTQIILFDAIQKGLKFEVLDESDQFIKLSYREHVEIIKNANMTSKDNYISPLIMENKTVTKKILLKKGYRIPLGSECVSKNQALLSYPEYSKTGFVVKPKTTNYGVGISIFKNGSTYEDFKSAIDIAFSEDSSILIEEFLPGTEYRFFVIGGEVKAILLRVPANVIGDGEKTIQTLVTEKNRDPLRGLDHRAPLEVIKIGPVEQLMLKEQGYTINSVPRKSVRVFLRNNSNISTGGDSIEVTDEFSEDYKKIAVSAVSALGANICGIDFIIPDKNIPADTKGSYGIIEANFNPAMYMHIYPYSGTGRRLTLDVLHFLFPEIKI